MTTATLTKIIKTYNYPSRQAFVDQAVEEKVRRLQQLEFFAITDKIKKGIESRGGSIVDIENSFKS